MGNEKSPGHAQREEEHAKADRRDLAADRTRGAGGSRLRNVNISEATFYRWKQQHGAMEPAERKELKALRAENARLKLLPIGIKWACDWYVTELLERLENQIFGQYPRAYDARYGIFFVAPKLGNRRWANLAGGRNLVRPVNRLAAATI